MILALTVLLYPANASSQQWSWAKHINGTCLAFDEDTKGNIYLLSTSATSNNVFAVTCMNDTGLVQWKKNLTGFKPSNLKVSDQRIYVVGSFTGTVTISNQSLTSNGELDAGFILSLDFVGNVKWLKAVTDTTNIYLGSLCLKPNNGGYFNGRASYLGRVWKFDSTGAINKFFDLAGTHSEGMKIDANENIYLFGLNGDTLITVSNSTMANTSFYSSYYFAKVNKDGVVRLLYSPGDTYKQSFTMPEADLDGNLISSSRKSEITLTKSDSVRKLIWHRDLTSSIYSGIGLIKVNTENDIYFGGRAWCCPFFECHKAFYGDHYMFFGKYDRDGNCKYVLSNGQMEGVKAISVRTKRPLVLLTSLDTGMIQLGPLFVKGGYVLARIDEEMINTSVAETDKRMNTHIYPNPAKGSVCISFQSDVPSSAELRLFNQQGQIIFQKQCSGQVSETIDVSGYPKGVYFLEVNGETRQTKKIVIE